MKQQLHKSISEIWQDQYVVPLYQRNFAWMEEQIKQLLQDIYDHRKDEGNYYLGSLVVLERNDGTFEVIDGQQRLTALQIICKELGILNEPRLRYDSRPEVEAFFVELFNSDSCDDCFNKLKGKSSQKIYRLKDALKILSETKIRIGEREEGCLKNFSETLKDEMKNYLSKKVILIRTPLPLDTDVAAYFEIMNNRGEQLQPHEVIKSLLMGDVEDPQKREIISTVWNACSEMDTPIQSTLSSYRLDKVNGQLFGEDFNTLKVEYLAKYENNAVAQNRMDIDEILNNDVDRIVAEKYSYKEEKYKSIIDFPNFLTHVFKLYNPEVELNGDNLRKGFDKIQSIVSDPMDFIKKLLTIRVLFDRYVVKLQAENEEDENLNWILHRPYLSHNSSKDSDSLKYKNSFSEGPKDEVDGEEENAGQKRIVKQLSMLQVTFRNQKYKNWLFDYMEWLDKNYGDKVEAAEPTEIEQFLDTWIENYYTHIENENGKDQLLQLGVNTPHFLFNYIDYLYWLEKQQEQTNVRYLEAVQDFKFKYYNSVEHHRPQSYNNEDINSDSIGNLCLISRRNNSSLNDKDAREKANIDWKGLQPKRRIMYKMTKDDDWGKKQIEEHEKDIEQLLSSRHRLLKI